MAYNVGETSLAYPKYAENIGRHANLSVDP